MDFFVKRKAELFYKHLNLLFTVNDKIKQHTLTILHQNSFYFAEAITK